MDIINEFNSFLDSEMNNTHNFISDVCSYFKNLFSETKLEDETIRTAVHSACDFFSIEDLPIKYTEHTSVFTNSPDTLCDDILGIGKQQLLDMGIDNENALTLICTHEIGHCLLQQMSSDNIVSGWTEELSCDAFMGCRSVIDNIDTTEVENSIKDEPGNLTQPNGDLRLRYIEIGKKIGEDLMNHDIPITSQNIMDRLVDFLKDDSSLITSQEDLFCTESNSSTLLGYDSPKEEKVFADPNIVQSEHTDVNSSSDTVSSTEDTLLNAQNEQFSEPTGKISYDAQPDGTVVVTDMFGFKHTYMSMQEAVAETDMLSGIPGYEFSSMSSTSSAALSTTYLPNDNYNPRDDYSAKPFEDSKHDQIVFEEQSLLQKDAVEKYKAAIEKGDIEEAGKWEKIALDAEKIKQSHSKFYNKYGLDDRTRAGLN